MVPAQAAGQQQGREAMTIAEQMKAIEKLKGAALREKFQEVTGLESRSNNRPWLIKRIADALHSRATSAPVAAEAPPEVVEAAAPPTRGKARMTKEQSEQPVAKRERDPRLPAPGTVLEREYDGKTIRVKVLEEGFEFGGKTYRSLSAIAREVTSQSWNGYLFFHIIGYAKRTKKAA
jgi:hypothetical protein